MKYKYRVLKPNQTRKSIKLVFISLCLFILALVIGEYIKVKGLITVAGIGVLISTAIALANRQRNKFSRLIEKYIRSNRYMQYDYDLKGNEVISYYPEIYYMIKDNELFLKFRLDGSLIGQKLRTLKQSLEDYLQYVCIKTIEEIGYITYCFELEKPTQLVINSLEELPTPTEDSFKLSNIIINWKTCYHFLIAGNTGSGKTQLVCEIMFLLRKSGVRVIYMDPKNDMNMKWFCRQHDIKYFSDVNEIAKAVRELEEEMRLRQQDLDNIGIDEAEFNPVYIFFDELLAYSKITSKKQYEEVSKRISSIVVQGRQKRIFYGAILQRPDTEFIDGATRENLNIRIYMGQGTETAYKMMFGSEFAHVKNYRTEKGSGLIYRVGIDTQPRELLVPYLKNK